MGLRTLGRIVRIGYRQCRQGFLKEHSIRCVLQEMFLMEMLFNAMNKSIIQCLSTLII